EDELQLHLPPVLAASEDDEDNEDQKPAEEEGLPPLPVEDDDDDIDGEHLDGDVRASTGQQEALKTEADQDDEEEEDPKQAEEQTEEAEAGTTAGALQEDEGEGGGDKEDGDKEPGAGLKRTVDEPEDEQEEDYDEGGEEKASVDVSRPVEEAAVCPCMNSAKAKEPAAETEDRKDAPRRVSAVRRRKEAVKAEEKPTRKGLPRVAVLEPPRTRRLPPPFRAKRAEKTPTKTPKKKTETKKQDDVPESEQEVGPCRPAPVYCPAPPGWYVHHVVTDNPYPPPTMPAPSA
uniref:Uncharacterized protein n=1 Tax=Gasterosteus aculeatus TaxID=69293 RepID=G3PEM2_GASAC